MENGSTGSSSHFQHLRDAAWEAIGDATVDSEQRVRHWKAWQDFCSGENIDIYLEDSTRQQQLDTLLAFAVSIRQGDYGNGAQVGVQSVETALRHVGQKFVLDQRPDPRRSAAGQHNLDLPIQRLIKFYRDRDPAPRPQLAVPVSTIETIAKSYHMTPHHSAVADLVTIAFFFLLRVGEYTSPYRKRSKRTQPLRRRDVRLWKNGVLISHHASLSTLLSADGATIFLENQKNGKKGSTVHHEAIGTSICPVAALARRVHHLAAHSKESKLPLGTVFKTKRKRGAVSDRDIATAVRWGALMDNLLEQGYTLDRVSSHSLRSGGAMALKLNGADSETIMRVGRWTSLTYLTYIHTQISAIYSGLSAKMATKIVFHCVG